MSDTKSISIRLSLDELARLDEIRGEGVLGRTQAENFPVRV